MSENIVQAQYEQLEQIAARFAMAAETQQTLSQSVSQRVDVLRQGGWQGKGIAAFLREMDGEVGPATRRLISALQQATQTTQMIVSIMREADLEASQPFQTVNDEIMLIGGPVIIDPGFHIDPDRVIDGGSSSNEPAGPGTQNGSAPSGSPDSQNPNQPPITQDEIRDKIRRELGRLPNENGEQCVRWVADRIENLTNRRPPAIGIYDSDLGAQNYRFMFEGVRQFGNGNQDSLLAETSPGAILVWTKQQANNTFGHVAVVERVTDAGIYISEANWDANQDGQKTTDDGIRFIPKEKLAQLGLYLIPAGASAVSKEQFSQRKKSAT